MKTKYINIAFISLLLLFNSCSSELDTKPRYELSLENLLKQDPDAIKGMVSKMYGSFALTGPNGPGSSDISGPDPGETAFLRGIINLQDFTADGVKNLWGDDGLDQLTTTSNWTPSNKFFRYLFDRVYYTVPQCSNIIVALNSVQNIPNKQLYIDELRFLRSLAYYYMIDCFGKGVLATTENYGTNEKLPEASRLELFKYVESEMLSVETTIPETNDYGRANKATVRMLLANLYLNAEVYTGQARYNDALTYVSKVINDPANNYTLATDFVQNFSADNNTSKEIIFPLIADPLTSQSYGNTTYIVNGSLNAATMTLATYGATSGWGGHRATKAWYGLFGADEASFAASTDKRAKLFYTGMSQADPTKKHTYEMLDYKVWKNGYPSIKFRNTNFFGTSVATDFSGTDFPLYRLADAYLIYAECVLRGASNGSLSQALTYVNDVRTRSNASAISTNDLTLSFILDERGRELNFEGHRRTDLIRFGKFTGDSYLWPWKGGVFGGASIPDTYKLFPIPLTALSSNPNIRQNPGY